MLTYVARAYAMGSVKAEERFKAPSHETAIQIATAKLGHHKYGRDTRSGQGGNKSIAIIGVRAV